MYEAADVQGEISELAGPAGRDAEDVACIPDTSPADRQVTDLRFSTASHGLGPLVAVSKLLPVGLNALLAERALGPVLAARIAAMLEPSRTIDVATKLPAMFLADAATHVDPRVASTVIAGLPPAHIAEVTRELARRGEFATIGQVAGHLGANTTAAAPDAMDATMMTMQAVAAGQPRGRLLRSLAAAALVTLAAVSVVVIVSPGAARHAKPAVSRHAIAQRSPLYWTVRPGDTFWQISEETKLTISQLEAYNPNTDSRALIVGQRLNLTP